MRTHTQAPPPAIGRSRPPLTRWTVVLLLAIVPLAVIVSFFIPRYAPLDPVLIPVQAFFIGLFLYHLGLVA